jgi:hypothetical protein
MRKKAFCAVSLVFIALFPVLAQKVPKTEVFGGYSWAGGNFHGWNASVAGNVTKRLGIVADFNGQFGSELGLVRIKQDAHSFLLGPLSRKEIHPFCVCIVRGDPVSRKRNHQWAKTIRLRYRLQLGAGRGTGCKGE